MIDRDKAVDMGEAVGFDVSGDDYFWGSYEQLQALITRALKKETGK